MDFINKIIEGITDWLSSSSLGKTISGLLFGDEKGSGGLLAGLFNQTAQTPGSTPNQPQANHWVAGLLSHLFKVGPQTQQQPQQPVVMAGNTPPKPPGQTNG